MHPVRSQLLSSYSINDQVNMHQVGGHEFKIACQYEYLQSYVRAQFWYQTAAKKGHSHAQNNLAVMYALGRVEDAAPIDALSWLLKAAEQGDVKAESNLNCLQISQDALGKQSFVI